MSEDAEPEETSGILGDVWKTQEKRDPAIREPAVLTENGKPLKILGRNNPAKMQRGWKARGEIFHRSSQFAPT